jgi:stress response protein YsnF
MEALESLLNSLKKREFKTFEEANAQLAEVLKLKDAVVAFEKESLMKIVPATFTKTQQFVTAAKNDLKKLESDASNVVKRALDDLYSNVKSHFTTANQMHYHNRYAEASDSLQKARAALGVLDTPPYNLSDAAKTFVGDYRAQIETTENKIADSLMGSLVDDKIRGAKTHGSNAKQMHYENRYKESLNHIAKARESIAELSQTPYNTHSLVVAFLPDYIKLIDTLEAKCCEEMYGSVINDKIRSAETHGTKAKEMHYQSRYQESLEAIVKAREKINELSQSPYVSLELVKTFLYNFVKQIDDLEMKCGEAMFSRLADDKIHAAMMHGIKAKEMHYQNRYQEALDAVAKAREVIAELQGPWTSLGSVASFLPNFLKEIDQYERQCGEALFSKVVDEKIRIGEAHATTAKQMHFESRYQEALDAVAKAREVIAELKEAPYNALKSTQEFLSAFEKQIDQYERQCGEALFGRVVEEKIRAVKNLVTEAEQFHNHSRNQEALTSVAKAREAMIDVEKPPFAALDATIAYLQDAKPALDALEGNIGETLFGRFVEDKIRAANTHLTTAKQFHSQSLNSEALSIITKAREAVTELGETPYNTIAVTVAFLKETRPALDELESKVGEAMFGRIVYDKINACKTQLNFAKNSTNHGQYQEALDSLTKASKSLSELESPPFNALPLVISYVSEARADLSSLKNKITAATGSSTSAPVTTPKPVGSVGSTPIPAFAPTPTGAETVGSVGSSTLSTPTTPTPAGTETEGAAVVEQQVFVAPIFPKGPIADTLGPWVPHVYSPLKTAVAQSDSSAATVRFIDTWNTTIADINNEWENAVYELARRAKLAEKIPLEDLYVPPRKIEGNWTNALSMVKLLQKQVRELPANDALRRELLEQVTTATENIEENRQRETSVASLVKVLDKASAVYVRLKTEAARLGRRDHSEFLRDVDSDWRALKSQFARIPLYEERVEKIMRENFTTTNVGPMLSIAEVVYLRVKSNEPIHEQELVVDTLKKLEKWPAAHRYCIRRLTRIWNYTFRFQMEKWCPEFEPIWPTPTAPADLIQPNEEALGLPSYEMIRPGTPEQTGLPFANRPDQSTKDAEFAQYTLPYAGKIVFSTSHISPHVGTFKSSLQTKFSFADSINARAVWPRAIANYPFAKNKDGTPVYTVEDIMDRSKYTVPDLVMSVQVKIDGKLVFPKYQFQDSIGYLRYAHDEKLFDYQQSLGFDLLGNLGSSYDNFSNVWRMMSRLLTGYLLRAGHGAHKVDVALYYNLFDGNPHHQKRVDNPSNIDTLTSHPLAEGSFEVDVPIGAKFPDDFGPTVAEPVALDAMVGKLLKEGLHLIWARQDGDWDVVLLAKEEIKVDPVTRVSYVVKTPAKYGKHYSCIAFERTSDLDYVLFCAVYVIAGPKPTWDNGIEEVWLAQKGMSWDPSFLPESLLAKLPDRRL